MLRFAFARCFQRSLKGLHPREKVSIQNQVDSFMLAVDVRRIPDGFGLKWYQGELWEFRTDIAFRVLFSWKKDSIVFLFSGNQNEVRQFARHYL